jgi:hypothetical protein
VRLGILVLVLALASGGATIRAQGKSDLWFSHAPQVPSLRTYDFDEHRWVPPDEPWSVPPIPPIDGFGVTHTCPMPVFRTGGANDPMPVARGGLTEPMPVARSSCWNPLDPQD